MKNIYASIILLVLLSGCGLLKKELKVTSSSFKEGELLIEPFTCEGRDISPELSWSQVPSKTKTIAVVMEDSNAPDRPFAHWLIFNLQPTVRSIPQAISDRNLKELGGVEGENSFNKREYSGACPPRGDAPHDYIFTVYALDKVLDLKYGAKIEEFNKAIKGHVVAQGNLKTMYFRSKK